jgi:subfamily B ATP-binding cassette protein MsbA
MDGEGSVFVSDTSQSSWRSARRLVWRHRRRLGLGFVLLVVARLAALVLPASSKFLIDNVIGQGRAELLVPLAAAILLATLVQAATSVAISRVLGLTAQRAIMDVRRKLQRKAERLPIRHFDSLKTGVLVSRIVSDPDALRNLLGSGLVQLVGNLLTAGFALVVLLYLNWRLTLVSLMLLGAFSGLLVWAFNRIRPIYRQRAELGAQLAGRLTESLAGIRVVKAYRAEKHEERVFTAAVHRLFRTIVREITTTAGVGAASIAIFGGLSALLVLIGGRSILAGSMTLGDFVMYVFFIGLLAAPLARIADTGTRLSEALAGLDRIQQLEELASEEDEDEGRDGLPALEGEVEFRDVTFEYAAGSPVLRGISFRAPAGTTTALVGPSGAGKSTVIGLVMGFHRPRRGRILVDGTDLAGIRLRDYRAFLGVVLQETFLFDGTVAENIAYAHPRASREEVVEAARVAHCHDFVSTLEKGYDTLVGERGVKLSGGQRQRVAIARAVLANPRILILDEATSQLDSESEALIQDGLRSLRRGRTTFVIAHRLSTIRSADQILVMQEGAIVERGTHESLLAQGGRYRDLYERQHHLLANRFINPGEAPQPVEETAPEPEPDVGTVGSDLPLPWRPSKGEEPL